MFAPLDGCQFVGSLPVPVRTYWSVYSSILLKSEYLPTLRTTERTAAVARLND
jgi:hypothetical protein